MKMTAQGQLLHGYKSFKSSNSSSTSLTLKSINRNSAFNFWKAELCTSLNNIYIQCPMIYLDETLLKYKSSEKYKAFNFIEWVGFKYVFLTP